MPEVGAVLGEPGDAFDDSAVAETGAFTAHHLGNCPHAFSHLALIDAAARIILLEGLKELA